MPFSVWIEAEYPLTGCARSDIRQEFHILGKSRVLPGNQAISEPGHLNLIKHGIGISGVIA